MTPPEGWFRLTRGETVHYFPKGEDHPLCGMINRIPYLAGSVAVESVNEEARCRHCVTHLSNREQKAWYDVDKMRNTVLAKAQRQSRLEMFKETYRLMMFNAGASFYCKICGNQQPTVHSKFKHRPGCPGEMIQQEVDVSGVWRF